MPGKSAGDQRRVRGCNFVVLVVDVDIIVVVVVDIVLVDIVDIVLVCIVYVSRCRRFRAPAHRHPHLQQKRKQDHRRYIQGIH